MTFRSLETRCKSPFPCFCFRFQCLIYVALADSRCISDGSTSVQEAFKATKAKSSCPIWRLRNFAGHWSGSFWKGLLLIWFSHSESFYHVISNEFIRSFHQFVSRNFLRLSSWKRSQTFYWSKTGFSSVCELIALTYLINEARLLIFHFLPPLLADTFWPLNSLKVNFFDLVINWMNIRIQ